MHAACSTAASPGEKGKGKRGAAQTSMWTSTPTPAGEGTRFNCVKARPPWIAKDRPIAAVARYSGTDGQCSICTEAFLDGEDCVRLGRKGAFHERCFMGALAHRKLLNLFFLGARTLRSGCQTVGGSCELGNILCFVVLQCGEAHAK